MPDNHAFIGDQPQALAVLTLVIAPLSSVVLATVKPIDTSAGSGMYGTTVQVANAAIGAVFPSLETTRSPQGALFAVISLFSLSIMTCVHFCR